MFEDISGSMEYDLDGEKENQEDSGVDHLKMYKANECSCQDEESFNVEVHKIKNTNSSQKPKEVVGFTLQTDRPSEQSALPDPETKPVLAFERSLDSVEF